MRVQRGPQEPVVQRGKRGFDSEKGEDRAPPRGARPDRCCLPRNIQAHHVVEHTAPPGTHAGPAGRSPWPAPPVTTETSAGSEFLNDQCPVAKTSLGTSAASVSSDLLGAKTKVALFRPGGGLVQSERLQRGIRRNGPFDNPTAARQCNLDPGPITWRVAPHFGTTPQQEGLILRRRTERHGLGSRQGRPHVPVGRSPRKDRGPSSSHLFAYFCRAAIDQGGRRHSSGIGSK